MSIYTTNQLNSRRLVSCVTLRDGDKTILFDATPQITETTSVEYTQRGIPQLPTSINSYEGTHSRTFSVSNIRLISRTRAEARSNLLTLWTLRGWTKPNFGRGDDSNKQSLGMPPKILFLSAYNSPYQSSSPTTPHNILDVPVVITSLSIEYPQDVDYIPDTEDTPVPVVQTITLELLETQSPANISRFSLRDYKQGLLKNY